ncbi:MAG: rhomboid family intramembrane serine protease [Planctomycetaceae bacterium]|jgi:membrane associated rhomboid family serine protease|nr:rhomboid family intramembrane serine protease [Planctomycetaceae bacterium]
MFFPYNTDAPLYHRPVITVILIVVNVVVFFCEVNNPKIITEFALEVGNGLHPIQWLTCNFLHAGIMHLVGNMISFWAFGLVVEGKLGLIRTLFVYLGIGIIYGAIVQISMLGNEPTYCLGASAIIFGIMSICLVWAPENSMECFLLIRFTPIFFEVRIKTLVGIFLALQVCVLILTNGSLSSEFLHVVGAITGFIVGIWMLKSGQVDCENWDIFSVWAGRHTMTDIERKIHDANTPKAKQQKIEQIKKRQNMMLNEIRFAINNNTPIPAFVIAQKMIHEFHDVKIPEADLLLLIRLLIKNELWSQSIEMMQVYLSCYTSKALPIQLNLARIFIATDKPRAAEKLLAKIDPQDLDSNQYNVFQSLKEQAQTKSRLLEEQGTYEIIE